MSMMDVLKEVNKPLKETYENGDKQLERNE